MFNSVDSNIQLGVLTKQPDLNIYGRIATTAGWGEIENNTRSTRLRKVDLKIHYPDNCSVYDTSIDNNFVIYLSANLLCSSATPPALINCVRLFFFIYEVQGLCEFPFSKWIFAGR